MVSLSTYKHDTSDAHQEQLVGFLRTNVSLRDDDPIAAIANWCVWIEDFHTDESFLESLDKYLTAARDVSTIWYWYCICVYI